MKIKKAIIPAAGFGTRFLPATKSQPKEMIPVVDKPVIQYVVEEAVEAGITDILMVIGKGKRAIEEHFDRNYELENRLAEKGKTELLEKLRHITSMANIHFVWQKELNGLGDAIRYGKYHIGQEPFAILLGDTILESHTDEPVTKQLMNVYEKYESSVVALETVPKNRVNRYGVMDGKPTKSAGLHKVNQWVEKPNPEEAPSNLVVAGRYILTPAIFNLLENLPVGLNNEIQLTDAMRLLLNTEDMYGLQFSGKRHDLGNKLDFIKTNVHYGLKSEEFGAELRAWLKDL